MVNPKHIYVRKTLKGLNRLYNAHILTYVHMYVAIIIIKEVMNLKWSGAWVDLEG